MTLAGTIRTQMLAAGLAGLMILFVIGGVGMHGIRSGTNALAQVFEQRVEPMRRLQEIDRELKEIRFRMAGVLLDQMPTTGSRIHLGKARAAIAENWTAFKAAMANDGSGETKKLVDRIDKSMASLPIFLDRLEGVYGEEDTKALGRMLEEEWPSFHAGLSKPMEMLIPAQQAAVKETYEANRASGAWMIAIAAGSAAAGMLLMGIVGWLLMREMHGGVAAIKTALAEVAGGNLSARATVERRNEFGEMAQSLGETTAKLAEVAGSIRGLSEKTSALAEDLSERMAETMERGKARNSSIMSVSAAIEEISAASASIADSAAAAEAAARRNEKVAATGNSNMTESLDAAREVVAAIESSSSHVVQLNGSIQEIGKIAFVIKDIADQTNLLALNAAIEAARAGEQGRGFAVVADEVRKLAERTTSSTAEITSLIESIRKEAEQVVTTIGDVARRVEASTGLSQSTGEILCSIVSATGDTSSQISQIAASVREQSSATEDIARQVAEIADLTERNALSLQAATEIAANMSTVSQQLRDLARHFR